MLNITKKYSLEPFRFTTMSTLPRNISDWDYETYGSQDWFVITFSNGWKQWPLDCILFSRVYFIPRSCIFLCLFSLRYEPPPMDPTMVGSHWDLKDRVVEYLPQLGGDHTITKRTCSFCDK